MYPVSIIVPTYNQTKYLPACLDSIWFQDFPGIEIVVVDDGSSDGTEEVLEGYREAVANERASFASNYDVASNVVERTWHPRYPQEEHRLVCLRHEKKQGLGVALNTGFQAASGEYCTFITPEDLLLPSMVSDLLLALERNGADFAYADMHMVDAGGNILRHFELPDYSFESAFCRWYMLGICKLYRRELHDKFGYYAPEYTSLDHEMYLRFAMGGARFVHVPKVLARVRIHEKDRKADNLAVDAESRQMEESKELVKKARAFAAGKS